MVELGDGSVTKMDCLVGPFVFRTREGVTIHLPSLISAPNLRCPFLIGDDFRHAVARFKDLNANFLNDLSEDSDLWKAAPSRIAEVLLYHYTNMFSNLIKSPLSPMRPASIPSVSIGLQPDWRKHFKGSTPPRLSPLTRKKLRDTTARMEANGFAVRGDPRRPAMRPLLRDKGVLQPSRLTIQAMELNDLTRQFHLPPCSSVEKIHDIKASHRIFSIIDLTNAFYQVPVARDDSEALQFWGADGDVWRLVTMAQGIVNGSSIFSRLLKDAVRDVPHCDSFIDELWASAASHYDMHLTNLKIFHRLNERGHTVNLYKLAVNVLELSALSFKIQDGMYMPARKFRQALEAISTTRQAKTFVRSCQYFADFVPHFSRLTAVVRDANDTDPLSPRCVDALQKMVAHLDGNKLAIDDWESTPTLITDWSKEGKSAMLLVNGKIVRICSARCDAAEADLSAPEGELVTGAWAMTRLGHHLVLRPFIWLTDCQAAALALGKRSTLSPYLARRHDVLSNFQFDIKTISGNCIPADYWSRFPIDPPDPLPAADPVIVRYLQPESFESPMATYHSTTHAGIKPMAAFGMRKLGLGRSEATAIARLIARDCKACNFLYSKPVHVPLTPRSPKRVVMHSACMDVTSWSSSQDILTIQDPFSKMLFAALVPRSPRSADVVSCLTGLYQVFPFKEIWVDGGVEFRGDVVRFCTDRGVQISVSPPYHKQPIGQAERAHNTIKRRLLAASRSPEFDLARCLHAICVDYNSTPHSLTKTAPKAVTNGMVFEPTKLPTVKSNIKPGQRVFVLKKPLEAAVVPLKSDYFDRFLHGHATVRFIDGGAVTIRHPNGEIEVVGPELLRVPNYKDHKF